MSLITRGKRKFAFYLSKLFYGIKQKLPRLPRFYLSQKVRLRFMQTGVSFIVFIFVVGIFQLDDEWARGVQKEIKSYFSQEKDYSAQVKDYLTFGWWLNSYDRMAFTTRSGEEIPVIAGSQPSMSVPVNGTVVTKFGPARSEDGQEWFREGIEIEAPVGTPIVAVLQGKVVRVTTDPILGRLVQLDHGNGVYSLYGYCSEILVREGQEVARNQVIAKVGQTGKETKPMLYFELRERGQLIDPLTRLPGRTGI